MIFKRILKDKSFLIYGLGLTGLSAGKFLKKLKAKKIFLWDDNSKIRNKHNIKGNEKYFKKKLFIQII